MMDVHIQRDGQNESEVHYETRKETRQDEVYCRQDKRGCCDE